AYVSSVLTIPLLRRKAEAVIERSGFAPQSHSGKDLLRILEDLPRDEMFQTSLPDLYQTAIGVLHLQERRRLRLFMRKDVYGRFVSCLVYLPRERYSTQVRLRMRDILLEALGGTSVDDTLRVAESVLARVHFVVRVDTDAIADVDRDALERQLVAATRTWDDDFAEALQERFGDGGRALADRYVGAFPEAYKEDFPAHVAVDDLLDIERLGADGFDLRLYKPDDASPDELRLKLYRLGASVSLSQILPLLQSMGVEVTDERPYGVERRGADPAWIYDFGLRHGAIDGSDDVELTHHRFQDALAAAWRGDAEADGFQALVLRAGLHWRQVVVLRAYAKYLRQAGSRFSQEYVESALVSNAGIARLLVELFEARLDPGFDGDRDAAEAELSGRIEKSLDDVGSLDEDRILRSYLSFVNATLRTNYWQRVDGQPKPYLSLKFASEQIPDLPQPRPKFEIFVYSPRIEGVHLRFGPVARGGIRYSDRREDFRTEVLGLAKTQTVKNAVIVPVGSKGGFVVKRPPVDADRDAQQAEVVHCYETLIRGLLDLTDNLVTTPAGRQTMPPADTVRHDGDDSYLVVAADKGTATFSDIANGISAEYGFWLGDAFASGGSAGYDHKAMGITARGAWESVKRHFRDVGVNCQTTDFTCVGIGDMSGDVFGNGMLLSRHIKLVAAFDHRHVFIDPDPDPASSFEERSRLFALPRSSWADYNTALISKGGGVWPRTAKAVPVSPEMAAALGIPETPLAPSDLMRAVLRAPVDLLWNGGIGTYVKSHTETNVDVGDRANDAIRVDGRDLRCKIVGEGGNLGFTQRGRIEFALAGGRINTDAIDNSAGVDTSDHEVNIKILLDVAARSGRLDSAERGPLLAGMTDEIAALVLRDNYAQNLALACSQAQAPATLHVHAAYIDLLEKQGHLSRALEQLPDADTIAERRAAGLGLMRPEIAVLLAYAKITTTQDIAASDLSDDIFAQQALVEYFPSGLREPFAVAMAEHPLLREIIATQLANQLVNYSGATFVARLAGETTASTAEIVRAHTAARQVFDTDAIWADIEALDDLVTSEVQTSLLIVVRYLLDRASRWFLANRRPPMDVPETVSRLEPGVRAVLADLGETLRGDQAERFAAEQQRLVEAGVAPALARRAIALGEGLNALSIVEIALRANS
ncbi:MAG TPA: NAD-glutamate dehydrogenase, partial [Acidothermaceae bacterium]|nr:NAD-glutamate dehydrogenase [Acidothermaceae bacterium]